MEPLHNSEDSPKISDTIEHEGHRHHHVLIGGLRPTFNDYRALGHPVREENVSMAQCLVVARTSAACSSCHDDDLGVPKAIMTRGDMGGRWVKRAEDEDDVRISDPAGVSLDQIEINGCVLHHSSMTRGDEGRRVPSITENSAPGELTAWAAANAGCMAPRIVLLTKRGHPEVWPC